MWHGGEGSLQRGTRGCPQPPSLPYHPPRLQQPSPLVSRMPGWPEWSFGNLDFQVGLSEPL